MGGGGGGDERRIRDQRRVALPGDMNSGWLAFESTDGERRRVAPIPQGWDALEDAALLRLAMMGQTPS